MISERKMNLDNWIAWIESMEERGSPSMPQDDFTVLSRGGAVESSMDAVCWWCRIDPIDGSLAGHQHGDYRFLCKSCRRMLDIFSSYFARLQDVTVAVARDELMKFIGLERVAMRLEMVEMRERVHALLEHAHRATAWINGVPSQRLNSGGSARATGAPSVYLPIDRKKDVM